MSSKMSDLNDHLFEQLERLSNTGLTADEMDLETQRSRALVSVADRISGNADLQLKAAKLFAEHGQGVLPMLPEIGKATE